jgi:hypothetical protein
LAEPPETPRHGYQLMKRLEEHSGGVYVVRASGRVGIVGAGK